VSDPLLADGANNIVVLSVNRVHKTFKEVEVLKGIDFQIMRGQTTCLLGNNGSGKTTLINIIVGFK
jgi:ABC-type multidrug transport system ATPase subunit